MEALFLIRALCYNDYLLTERKKTLYNLTDCTVVGIIGNVGVGKTTVAKYLRAKYDFVTFNFSDELKLTLHWWFDIPLDVLLGPSEKKSTRIRQMMQHLGTDFGRTYNPDVWTVLLYKRINEYLRTGIDPLHLAPVHIPPPRAPRIVIPDVRFPNEATLIATQLKGTLIRLTKENPITSTDMTPEQHAHLSETALNNIDPALIDHTITNDGNSLDLEEKLAEIFVGLNQPPTPAYSW